MFALRRHAVRLVLSVGAVGALAAAVAGGQTTTQALGHPGSAMTMHMDDNAIAGVFHNVAEVTPTRAGAAVTGDVGIKVSATSVSGPSKVSLGFHVFTVAQSGKSVRDVYIAQLKPGYSLKQLAADDKASQSSNEDTSSAALVSIVKHTVLYGGSTSQGSAATNTSFGLFLSGAGTYYYVNTPDDSGSTVVTPFTVPAGTAVSPKVPLAGSISTREYGFDVKGVVSGIHNYTLHDSGRQAHIMELVAVPKGTTAAKVLGVLESNGAPPKGYAFLTDLSGVQTSGKTIYRALRFSKGQSYALICFLPEQAHSGPPHFVEGMIKVFTVTK